jgi:putative colanic acid biosysnthesis UDP-glucose lipid carrier transferase
MSAAYSLSEVDEQTTPHGTIVLGVAPDSNPASLSKVRRVAFNTSYQRLTKRGFDCAIAVLTLILLSPLFLMIAIAIRMESAGPVFFRQQRGGVQGKSFIILKFRTMYHDPASAGCAQATRKDRRVTVVGHFLRRTSLDELPQFINVIKGEMSVVGPRPHAIEHDEKYASLIPSYSLRYMLQPGLTGWAQVNRCRGETQTVEKMLDRVRHDIYYVENGSLWLDLKIIALTPFALFGANIY